MTTSTPTDVRALATAYGDAWNRQDVDAVLAHHAPDSVFAMHAPGYERAEGTDAVRAAFEAFVTLIPDIHFAERRLLVGDDFWILESTMTGTLNAGVELDGEFVDGVGRRVDVDCVDVIKVRDGLVSSKDTYLDGLTFAAQVGALA